MLTPSKYWRVPAVLNAEVQRPPKNFILPDALVNQKAPPSAGHGIAIAAYDEHETMGHFLWLGIVKNGSGSVREVDWRPTSAQIWVDTSSGRGYWKRGAFGFAETKVAGYGLHELWQSHFDGLELRQHVPASVRPRMPRMGHVSQERLTPIEVIGEQTTGTHAGVVYVLKSAYGYKVGRTNNVPSRMRAFGVRLPFIYTIPFCVWFQDCHEAERRYHEMFAGKRINGEWFDLDESDIVKIKSRA